MMEDPPGDDDNIEELADAKTTKDAAQSNDMDLSKHVVENDGGIASSIASLFSMFSRFSHHDDRRDEELDIDNIGRSTET